MGNEDLGRVGWILCYNRGILTVIGKTAERSPIGSFRKGIYRRKLRLGLSLRFSQKGVFYGNY